MNLVFVLMITTGVSALLLIASGVWYWRVKQKSKVETPAESVEDSEDFNDEAVTDDQVSQNSHWLELLDQQLAVCEQLSEEQQDLSLKCWHTFLSIERELLSGDDEDVTPYLSQFEFVLEQLQQAQEIDVLLKRLSVSNNLLKELNKVIQHTGDLVFDQMNITADLNAKLDKQQEKLNEEQEVDQELASVRAELASMYELGERLKADADNSSSKQYLDALSEFLGETSSDGFLAPMRTELDDKVDELQHLADYRASVINELKDRVSQKREVAHGKDDHLAEYDIAFARFEKSLLESNRVIKSLENKLESLQTIKYNLNVDVRKREEALRLKGAQLESKDEVSVMSAQEALANEYDSVEALSGFIDAMPFHKDYEEFESEQLEKLASLKKMVDDSELYVNVLERDLDKAKLEYDQLTQRLNGDVGEVVPTSQEQEEIENLKEINAELEDEKRRLLDQLDSGADDNEEVLLLQKKIADLDAKIDTVQANYVNMEERYLNSLMS